MANRVLGVIAMLALLATGACSSSSSSTGPSTGTGTSTSSPTQNVLPIVVNTGPTNDYLNGVFASVTVCAPGSTTSCQTIDGILVDTGSSGLRILSSALSVSLPQQIDSSGRAIGECGEFQDGYTWGPVQTADIKMAGEQASSVAVQVVGGPGFPAAPSSCANIGPSENTLATLGANGILGVGNFRQDCGIACAVGGNANPGFYFACPASGCVVAIEPLASQLQNPVWLFAKDNNGIVIDLPAVSAAGAITVNGSMIFGIGTQSNNALGSAKVLTTTGQGTVTTIFNGRSYGGSFIDSGSNGIYFLDAATTGLPLCSDDPDFYCPTSTRSFAATMQGANGVTAPIAFSVANADLLFSLFAAFNNVAGPNPGTFDWGLPFFYGHPVFIGIEGQSSSGGVGPYWAY